MPRSFPAILLVVVTLFVLGLVTRGTVPVRTEDPNVTETRRLVATWADTLDRQTTDAGIYERWPNDTLPERDPWDQELRVEYSQGGVAEHVTVRSLGPDGESHTSDDVIAIRRALNLKGIGTGIKQNAEETTMNAAKGLVKGLVTGAKEAAGKGK